jgi:hypothetical protein
MNGMESAGSDSLPTQPIDITALIDQTSPSSTSVPDSRSPVRLSTSPTVDGGGGVTGEDGGSPGPTAVGRPR